MTLHFAAARLATRSPIARALARRAPDRAANDNGTAGAEGLSAGDAELHAALRHFAAHGLGAAHAAKLAAEQAHARGDREAYERWLGICRALDRRLAGQLARRHAALVGHSAGRTPR